MDKDKIINACGLSCPQPALLTHQALSDVKSGTVHVLVDSSTARDNVARTAQNAGWQADVQKKPDGSFQITLTK
jgi:tRNA 2-thiouridine synthesizing protein A